MVSNSAKLDRRTKQHTEFGVSASNGSRDIARTKVAEKKIIKKNECRQSHKASPTGIANDQEIINNIEATNGWAKVEFVYKLTDTGRMLKIRFNTTEMSARAVRDGLVVAYQRIPPRYIEKEIFVKLTPCYNYYSYEHKTQSCEIEKQSICTFCAKTGHTQNNCTESNPKCINCEGKHKTLASVCPVRKLIIKERSKDVRERSRSRSRARQVTYPIR